MTEGRRCFYDVVLDRELSKQTLYNRWLPMLVALATTVVVVVMVRFFGFPFPGVN